MQTGIGSYTDSAGSYRALKGYVHEFVHHTQKEYARGDVHEHRAECLFRCSSRIYGVARHQQDHPGGVCALFSSSQLSLTECVRASRTHLAGGAHPAIARRAKKGEFVRRGFG